MLALGAILESRDEILQKPTRDDVSKFFTHFKFLTEDQVESVVARAIALSEHAPLSLRKQLQGVVARYETSKAWIKLNIIGAPCLHVSILDVLRDKDDGRIIFFVDCRSEEELAQGMLPTAYPLPIGDLLGSTPAVFKDAIQRVKALQAETPELHFCLYGKGGHSPKKAGNAELTAVVYKLMREGFKHVSIIQNGYLGIHNFAMDGRVELTGHIRDTCPICLKHMSPFAKGFASMRGTFSKISHNKNIEVIKSRASNAITLIKQSIQHEEEEKKRRAERRPTAGGGPAVRQERNVKVNPQSKTEVKSRDVSPKPVQKEGLFTIGDDDEEEEEGEKKEKKSPKKKKSEEKADDKAETNTPKESETPKSQSPKPELDQQLPEKPATPKVEQQPSESPKPASPKPEQAEEKESATEQDKEEDAEKKDEEVKEAKKDTSAAIAALIDYDDDEDDDDDDEEIEVEVPEGYSTIQSWMIQYSLWEVTPENGANKWFVTVNDKEMTLLERHPSIFSYVRVVKSIPVKDIENAAEDKTIKGAVVTLVGGAQEKLIMDDAQEFVKAVKIALENKAM